MELEQLRARWEKTGTLLRPGASSAEVEAFEQMYGIKLPSDVAAFYRLMDGMEPGTADDAFISFWPLSEVGPVPDRLSGFCGVPDYSEIGRALPESSSYFAFADHSIWVNVYAVRLSPDGTAGPVVWISGKTWKVLSATYAGFMKLYASSPEAVIAP